MSQVHNLYLSSIGARRAKDEPHVIRVAIWNERGTHIAAVNVSVVEAKRFSLELVRAITEVARADMASRADLPR